jgi:hypothetical protein
MGDAPEQRHRTRPPNTPLILLKTNRSQMGDGVFPENKIKSMNCYFRIHEAPPKKSAQKTKEKQE